VRTVTQDRGAVLNAAGFQHLSPALRDGAPALVPEGETAGRTGWEPFFAAMARGGMCLSWDAEVPGSAVIVPASEARAAERSPSPG
jgi:hypothetical protein